MVRIVSTVLGMALGTLWVVGLTLHSTPPWLAWTAGLACALAYLLAAVNPKEGSTLAALGSFAMSAVCGPVAFLGLLSHGTPWLVWPMFAAAGVFGGMALYLGNRHAEIYRPRSMLIDW
jgi:hypothetical protein